MSIAKQTFPTFKQLYREITRELLTYEQKTKAMLTLQEAQKQKAKLLYQKLQRAKSGQSHLEIDEQLKSLDRAQPSSQGEGELHDLRTLHGIVGDKAGINPSYELNNLNNVAVYLRNQREYFDLLVRYNPGLSMDQSENVSRSANRVGLSVPE
ncbi:uncharacterized protein LODBEIA_P06100 [Lodderomyces beijingensis]|uniref:Uncharacterized protein n=1 Tax=Lodderomyces beijingensis TaxID=1775926 RepID=A0ABP0ZDY2_9ASCO